VEFKRDEDFEALYANSIAAESSDWDFKIVFGILDQSVMPNRVIQHTSINIPWTWAKLMVYYAAVAVALHEQRNGKVVIPPSVMPPDPDKITTEPFASAAPEVKALAKKVWDDFMAGI
jgi:hypothetical protein